MTRWLVRATLRPGRLSLAHVPVPGVRRVDQPVQLTTVEEDPATVGALVDVHAVAFVGPHHPVALGAGQFHARATPRHAVWFPRAIPSSGDRTSAHRPRAGILTTPAFPT